VRCTIAARGRILPAAVTGEEGIMKYACVAVVLLSALITLPGALSATPVNDSDPPAGWRPPDLSGTYMLARAAAPCSTASRAASALQVVQSSTNLKLRVLATQSVRLLPIERLESARRNPHKRNGLARWQGEELVVETIAPAFSLWGRPHAVMEGSRLTESFARTPDDMLLYRTWYTLPGRDVAHGPHEVQLTKCRSGL
jgi:hypothetical protein